MRWRDLTLAVPLLLATVAPSWAQSCPTAANTTPAFAGQGTLWGRLAVQLNAYFGAKVDANNGVICNPTILGTISGTGFGALSGDVSKGAGSADVTVLGARGSFFFSGTLTPTVLAGDVNDYNPPGLGAAQTLRMSGGAADRNITGIVGGIDGRLLTVINVGATNNLILKNLSGSSLAADRFALTADTVIPPAASVTLRYDNTSVLWRPLTAAAQGAVIAANSVIGNATGSVAAPAALAVPSCPDTGGNHLNWVAGSGYTCGTGVSGVTSFNGRAGVVVPASADYTATQVTACPRNLQFLTSASGTYTTPTCNGVLPAWIKLTGWGGGGGGNGNGTSPGTATAGGDTCWNTSGAACTSAVYKATGGAANGGAAGVGTLGDENLTGEIGGDGATNASANNIGGLGGCGPFRNGRGTPAQGVSGGSAVANSGCGGAGAGGTSGLNAQKGGSGGGGVRKMITAAIVASYTFTAGPAGAGGTAGTGGNAGGNGGTGGWEVEAGWQ